MFSSLLRQRLVVAVVFARVVIAEKIMSIVYVDYYRVILDTIDFVVPWEYHLSKNRCQRGWYWYRNDCGWNCRRNDDCDIVVVVVYDG